MRKALENYDGLRPSGCPCAAQGSESKGPFSFAKENGPFGPPRERLLIGSLGLDSLYASGMECLRAAEPRLPLLYDLVCSYYPLLRSRWRLCCLTDAAHPLRVSLCQSCRSAA